MRDELRERLEARVRPLVEKAMRQALANYHADCVIEDGRAGFAAAIVDALLSPPERPEPDADVFRCFHCREAFTGEEARRHFGDTDLAETACSIDVAKYREMEALVARYQAEDTDLHRDIHRLRADLHRQTQRAEEDGYANGLADGRALATERPEEGP